MESKEALCVCYNRGGFNDVTGSFAWPSATLSKVTPMGLLPLRTYPAVLREGEVQNPH